MICQGMMYGHHDELKDGSEVGTIFKDLSIVKEMIENPLLKCKEHY